jgi:hypothetical protein
VYCRGIAQANKRMELEAKKAKTTKPAHLIDDDITDVSPDPNFRRFSLRRKLSTTTKAFPRELLPAKKWSPEFVRKASNFTGNSRFF